MRQLLKMKISPPENNFSYFKSQTKNKISYWDTKTNSCLLKFSQHLVLVVQGILSQKTQTENK